MQRRPNRGVFVYEPQAEDIRELYRVRRVIQTGALRAADFSAEATAALRRSSIGRTLRSPRGRARHGRG